MNKWMVTVLFDVGSDSFYDCTFFIECKGDPREIAIREALVTINEDYAEAAGSGMAFVEKDIVDVLTTEESFIIRGFKDTIKE